MDYFWLVVILIPTTWIAGDTMCPPGCTCQRQSGVWKVVLCTNIQITAIPPIPQTDAPVKSLNVSHNRITEINRKTVGYLRQIEMLDASNNYIEKLENLPDTITVLNASSNLLSGMPDELPASLTVLELSRNQIGALLASHVCYLSNLRSLFLSNNKISKVISNLEDQECSVAYLILSNNKLEYIQTDMFSAFKKLKYLDLSRNDIKSVETGTFYDCAALKYLSFSQNMITSLPQKLPFMDWFDISWNKISKIPEEQKSDLYPQDFFLIGQNPLHCDCELLWLKELYDTKKYQLKYMDIDSNLFIPLCNTPISLYGKRWDTLANELFKCFNMAASTNEKEDNKYQIAELDATVNMSGENFVTVEWKMDKITTRSSDLVLIKIHPFGQKDLRKYYSVNLDARRYTIKSLKPKTPYVICVSVIRDKLASQSDIYRYDGSCLEVTTKNKSTAILSVWMKNVLQYIAILLSCVICLTIAHRSVKYVLDIVYKDKHD